MTGQNRHNWPNFFFRERFWGLEPRDGLRESGPPPIKMLFQIFRLNLSWDLSEMYYFSNKFSKIFKRWGFPPPAPLNLQYWKPEIPWFGQIVVFEADYEEIELQNTVMTSFQWRHHYSVTEKQWHHHYSVNEKRHKNFSNLGPSQSKFLATPVVLS